MYLYLHCFIDLIGTQNIFFCMKKQYIYSNFLTIYLALVSMIIQSIQCLFFLLKLAIKNHITILQVKGDSVLAISWMNKLLHVVSNSLLLFWQWKSNVSKHTFNKSTSNIYIENITVQQIVCPMQGQISMSSPLFQRNL